MRVEFGYTVHPDTEKKDDPLIGFAVVEGDISFLIMGREPNGDWLAIGSCPIDSAALEFVPANSSRGGWTYKTAGFIVPRRYEVGEIARSAVEALAFCARIPLTLVIRRKGDRLVPETAKEEQAIAVAPRVKHDGILFNAIVLDRPVDPANLRQVATALLAKQPGIALYNDALKASRPVAQFRELWRVLESAFGCKGDELVRLLASYPPARQMQFTEEELSDLLILRGKASHASGKRQAKIVREIALEVERRLPRLRGLVRWVLLTKKTWGVKTLMVQRLVRLPGYMDPSGKYILIRE